MLPDKLPDGDYVSPNFSIILPDKAFPNVITVANASFFACDYWRKGIYHNVYVDKRWQNMGLVNRDEAHILYNSALQFKGKHVLEIGCWVGWSACHLALAGVKLDVVDPLLAKPEFYNSVYDSLKTEKVVNEVNLVAGNSPQEVEILGTQFQRPWSLIFIDGNHDAPAPLDDAIVCERLAAEDAIILFHDLMSPEVAQGLDYLKQKGWNTIVYQTRQIVGAAWRGNVQPVKHQPDPKVNWYLPPHLVSYTVSC